MSSGPLVRRTLFCTGAVLLALMPAPAFAQEVIVPPDANWRYFKGTEEPPAAWNTVDFDDSAWLEGQSGFGYGDGDDTTVLDDMQNNYASVYIRHTFDLEDASQLALLQVGARYDDGFVAYLNGAEAARSDSMSGAGQNPPATALSASHEVNAQPEWFDVPVAVRDLLVEGENVLAIQGHNTTLGSSDLSLEPQLRFLSSLCPTEIRCTVLADGRVRLTWQFPIQQPPNDSLEVFRDGKSLGETRSPFSRTFVDDAPPPGEHTYEVVATIDGEPCAGDDVPSCTVTIGGGGAEFRRGDADENALVNITDAVFLLVGLFQGGDAPTCPDAADTDDNGMINITDAVFLLVHLFQSGDPPPPPGIEECGPDETDDDVLGECTYDAC